MSNLSNVATAYKNKRMNIVLGIDYGPRVTRAEEANRLSTPREIKLVGAVEGSCMFDGTSDVTIVTTGGVENDYNNLTNKPSINNVELIGNKTSEDLGVQPAIDYEYIPMSDSEIDDIVDDVDEQATP